MAERAGARWVWPCVIHRFHLLVVAFQVVVCQVVVCQVFVCQVVVCHVVVCQSREEIWSMAERGGAQPVGNTQLCRVLPCWLLKILADTFSFSPSGKLFWILQICVFCISRVSIKSLRFNSCNTLFGYHVLLAILLSLWSCVILLV